MNMNEYEYIVVGTGAGGATLANELSKRGKKVLVLERGRYEKELGTVSDTFKFYDMSRFMKLPPVSIGGAILWRSFMAGGSTVVSCANGVRCLEKQFAALGIFLDEEFKESEKELGISLIDEKLLSEGSNAIMKASQKLGYKMELMPKFIDNEKCVQCGNCVMGCKYGAKWSATEYVDEAAGMGVEIKYATKVEKVIVEGGKACGVSCQNGKGPVEFYSDKVIIAAGGLATPVILNNSGIDNAGGNLFIDLLVNTYGITDNGLNQTREPLMALVDLEFHESDGLLLSPNVNHPKVVRYVEEGPGAFFHSSKRMLGIMTKIIDEPVGLVHRDGRVTKPVTERDWRRLRKGDKISREILLEAGVKKNSFVTTRPQGAHPSGTAAIGTVVNTDLKTEIDNLYVCDASVLPESPGMPPILTLVALAKRQAKILAA